MMDFIRPDQGRIYILGMDSRKKAVALKSKIGYLPGVVRLYDKWTGQEHIDFVQRLKNGGNGAERLVGYLDFDPGIKARHLSLGNRQKLGLILALIGKPEVLFLDEPTLGLDPLLQSAAYDLLTEANASGTTIFMSSHNLAEVERICHRVGIIKEGKMVADEGIMKLKKKRMYKVTASFADKFDQNTFAIEGAHIAGKLSDGLILDVTGDINPVIRKLGGYELKDLKIEHASLTDIFMEFYEKR